MNPNSISVNDTETNEPNEWDALAESNTSNEGELTESTSDNSVDLSDTDEKVEFRDTPGTPEEGFAPLDETQYYDAKTTGYEATGEEGTGNETGDENSEHQQFVGWADPYELYGAERPTGDETMTGDESERPSTGTEEEGDNPEATA